MKTGTVQRNRRIKKQQLHKEDTIQVGKAPSNQ